MSGSEHTLCDTVVVTHAIKHVPKPIECTPPGMNAKVNDRLRVIVMHQSQFILGSKCTILVNDAGSVGGLCVCGGRGRTDTLCASQFCCKPKTTLEK